MAVTYAADRAERVLRQLTQAASEPVLTDEEVDDLLWRARVADASGYAADDPLWTPTYGERGIDGAAGRGWRIKAAKIKDKIKVGLGNGIGFDEEQEYLHCVQMAEFYEGKGGGGMLGSVALTTSGWLDD